MSHPSKQKGNRYEREIVKQAQEAGIEAERAWGSNGRALGFHEEVDCLLHVSEELKLRIQAKVRKKIAQHLKPSVFVDMQVIKEDRGESLAVIRYKDLLEILAMLNTNQP
jgi:hypothetical protein|tara:strand:+ start:21 stop:350 length:330 start_codon:yes stop_codon:yes gene_type:complete